MIWLIGSGYMATEYARVLSSLDENYIVIGNSRKSANKFKDQTKKNVIEGGIRSFLRKNPRIPNSAILCTPIETLFPLSKLLINYKIKNILVEKPGALEIKELKYLKKITSLKKTNYFIAYNRRFYQSFQYLKKRLKNEQLVAVNIEITEWSHTIDNFYYDKRVKKKWLISNTSHLIDLAFQLTGKMSKLSSYSSGQLEWHKSGSRFIGSGQSKDGILFSYHGYWDGPGRFSMDVITNKNRYIFKPLERLKVQKIKSLAIDEVDSIDYKLDSNYKPGLYELTKNFLYNKQNSSLCTLDEQIYNIKSYNKIAKYKS
ncbi:hypothetical protein OA537_01585 [Pelagibacteraceae bacterium]|nr:hypothetical protein [Pelagibacteraceae bacterium]